MPKAEVQLLDFTGPGAAFSSAVNQLPGFRAIRIVHRNLLVISVDVANRGRPMPRFALPGGHMLLVVEEWRRGKDRSRDGG